MNEPTDQNIETLRGQLAVAIHTHWKLFLVQGVIMMSLGLFAVALPHISTLAIEIFVGWLFLVGGISRVLAVLRSRTAPGFWWSLLTAVLAILLGLVLVLQPLQGVLTLTIMLVVIFAAEGIGAILISLDFRRHLQNWGWTLFSGIVDLVLAYLIWQGWPDTAAWAIGLLVGINMFFFGLALTMTAIAARAMKGD
jgi:uncharacterized membrane protein HdeD (DUF308 family)